MMFPLYPGYFVGLGTLALINAAIAQLQGRRTWVWFVVSLLGGPLVTLLLLLTYAEMR